MNTETFYECNTCHVLVGSYRKLLPDEMDKHKFDKYGPPVISCPVCREMREAKDHEIVKD